MGGQPPEGVLSQSPIVCLAISLPRPACRPLSGERLLCTKSGATTACGFLTAHTRVVRVSLVVLLRKEVIQPHLPVRLPCYDFVPIADPTFDGSLPEG